MKAGTTKTDEIIELIKQLYNKANLSPEIVDTISRYQNRIIELLKHASEKSPSPTTAIIHSINDTLGDDDVIAMLRSTIESYGKDDALFQIKRLMDIYNIHVTDIAHSVKPELKT